MSYPLESTSVLGLLAGSAIAAALYSLWKDTRMIRQDIQDVLSRMDGLVTADAAEDARQIKEAVDKALADHAQETADLVAELAQANNHLAEMQADADSQNADHNEEVEALISKVAELTNKLGGTQPEEPPVITDPTPAPPTDDTSGDTTNTDPETSPPTPTDDGAGTSDDGAASSDTGETTPEA